MSFAKPHVFMNRAWHRGFPVCGFNVDSFEMAKGVIEGIEQAGIPSFVQVTPATLDLWGWDLFYGALELLVRNASVEVGLHLDHASDMEALRRAWRIGFTSVMYDGSMSPLDKNILQTMAVVTEAHAQGVFVEAEVGHVGRDGEGVAESLTRVEDAVRFAKETGVDALAVAVGTKHGHVRGPGHLRFDRVREIRSGVEVPLVLHGASRLTLPTLHQMVAAGVTKINLGTELRNIWWQAIEQAHGEKPRVALARAVISVRAFVAKTLVELN